jgi:hypothetical protein
MSIRINKNARPEIDREAMGREFELFRKNAKSLLDHQDAILACEDYFFVPLAFAGCSFAYLGGGGPLCLGYLLLGWVDGILIEPCIKCEGQVRVVSFGGSPLSGSTAWSGFCPTSDKRRSAPGSVHSKFSWGGNGLEPSKRKVWRGEPTAKPITLETLIGELSSGILRKPNRPNVSLLKNKLELEFLTKSGAAVSMSPDDSR